MLAPVGYKQPIYNRGGDSRQHTSLSVMVPADGKHVLIRMVYKGKRKMASMITGIPTTGKKQHYNHCPVSASLMLGLTGIIYIFKQLLM